MGGGNVEGLQKELEYIVTNNDTAKTVGSGTLEVLATPRLIALLENIAMSLVEDKLEDGKTTVGTKVDVSHIAATPVGMKIKVIAKVLKVDGRRILFNISAYDQKEKILEGTHERYIITVEKFVERVYNKMK